VHQLEMNLARGVAWRGVTLSTSLHSIIRNVRFADVAEAVSRPAVKISSASESRYTASIELIRHHRLMCLDVFH